MRPIPRTGASGASAPAATLPLPARTVPVVGAGSPAG